MEPLTAETIGQFRVIREDPTDTAHLVWGRSSNGRVERARPAAAGTGADTGGSPVEISSSPSISASTDACVASVCFGIEWTA